MKYLGIENIAMRCHFFLTIGIEAADFVFYISAMETERCQKGMTVAYAAHCQQESALDRLVVTFAKGKRIVLTEAYRHVQVYFWSRVGKLSQME